MNEFVFALLFYAPLCAFIIYACVCRVNLLKRGTHKWQWAAMYTCFAAFALGEFFDVLRMREWMTLPETAGLLGIACNLWCTRASWHAGPPTMIWSDSV